VSRHLPFSISEGIMRRLLLLVSSALVTAACSEAKPAEKQPLGATPASASQNAPASDAITGTLLEQIAAAPYVYLRLKTASGEIWAAVNQTPLTVGAQVTVYGAILMEKFESKTLNRTFDRVYFGSLEAPNGPPPAMAGSGGSAMPSSVGTPPALDAHVPKVDKASGADARTIAEVWTQKDKLSNATVSVRGVVVKYNAGVMGKNWIHLQDGSGDATKGTHDITVTSLDAATMGSTVTITGTVHLNKDFGAGYSYAMIVEDAKVSPK
jgi:hypothetical protein